MLKIGDKVMRTPAIHIDSEGRKVGESEKALVVYIHPKGRYHEVRFDFPYGSFRESFMGVSE